MVRKIGIIGAMDDEIAMYKAHLKNLKETKYKIFTFYKGTMHDHQVILVKSGVGKVFASMICQYLIDKFDVETIICTGVGGSLNRTFRIGDVVVSKDAIQYDFDARPLGFKLGQISYTDYRIFPADNSLVDLALHTKLNKHKIIPGRIVTGDQFFTQRERKERQYLVKELKGDCIEMEGAAVAQVCHINEIPYLVVRTMSDNADGTAVKDYNKFTPIVASNSFKIVDNLLEHLD